jgi:hypothetical protein
MTRRLIGIFSAALKLDAEFERALAEIAQAPQRWASGPHHTRRFLLRKFPFLLIYRERAGGNLQIVAVAHTSRKPGYWQGADLNSDKESRPSRAWTDSARMIGAIVWPPAKR